jgi:hypothetical protein
METVMGVFDGRHSDVGIPVDNAWRNIVPKEDLRNWHSPAAICDPNVGTLLEVLRSGLDECFRSGWAIDIDRLLPV